MTINPHDPVEEFEVAFGPLLQGTLDMFSLEEATKDEQGDQALKPGGGLEDVLKVYVCEEKIKESRKRSREVVEVARNDLRAISRVYEQQKISTQRSSALPTPEEHEARMATALADRRARLKQNGELEQGLYKYQAELARLQQELKEEESDAFEVSELNGEVLRIKLYRDLGFTPVEGENGKYNKVLIRPRRTHEARAVELDDSNNAFYWSNYLWDQLE